MSAVSQGRQAAFARATGLQPAGPRGMTLVELMIGLAIGLFMTAVMGTIYVGSKTTFQSQESISRIQENGRFAIDMIGADLRMSGFRGCLGQAATTPFVNTLNSATDGRYNYGQPVFGSRYVSGAWSPTLDANLLTGLTAAGATPSTNSDVLVVRRPVGNGWSLTAGMTNGNSALSITANSMFAQGDILMVADCAGAAVLQATNATPGTAGSIQHVNGTAGVSPGVSTNSLGRAYLQDAVLWRMQTLVYAIAPSARRSGQLALWQAAMPSYGGPAAQELVTGVERMALTFGEDTNGDQSADQFHTAQNVSNWAQVTSARIELLLAGPDGAITTAPQPYVFNGTTTTPTDRRMRTVMSTTISLRNATP